jgi:hypothetical protein
VPAQVARSPAAGPQQLSDPMHHTGGSQRLVCRVFLAL